MSSSHFVGHLGYPFSDKMLNCEYFLFHQFQHMFWVPKRIPSPCFVALRPKWTAMVMAGRSVHLTTLFPGQGEQAVLCAHTFSCNWQQPFLNESAEGRRMTVEIISWSISTKVWNGPGLNSRLLDLQSDSHLLPDTLSTLLYSLVNPLTEKVLLSTYILLFLFELILYVPVKQFSVMSELVFLGWTNTKQGFMCLAQGHNAMMLVRHKPATPQNSTTEPLHPPPHTHTTYVLVEK